MWQNCLLGRFCPDSPFNIKTTIDSTRSEVEGNIAIWCHKHDRYLFRHPADRARGDRIADADSSAGRSTGTFLNPFLYTAGFFFATPVEKGALSRIFAAVSPEAKHGQYYGPIGKVESGSGLAQGRDLQEKLFGGQGELAGHDVEKIL